jgi:Flp pilus assembly protein TadD
MMNEVSNGWRVVCLLAASAVVVWGGTSYDRAFDLYQRTQYAQALKLLQADPNKGGREYELMGRAYYMSGDFKRASEALEKAVQSEPQNSRYHNWLGRAYGRRAETSSFVTAPSLATKARKSFEQAVELDPRNQEAVNDLFEYYLEAPGIMGGGLDKAEALSLRIRELSPAEYHFAKAKLAEKRKQYKAAEEQLRQAVNLAPSQVGRVVDLANFLAKRGRHQEADQTFARAEKIAPNSPQVKFHRARVYIESHRNLDEAKTLLEQYLASQVTPDDPPKEEARKLLKQVAGG